MFSDTPQKKYPTRLRLGHLPRRLLTRVRSPRPPGPPGLSPVQRRRPKRRRSLSEPKRKLPPLLLRGSVGELPCPPCSSRLIQACAACGCKAFGEQLLFRYDPLLPKVLTKHLGQVFVRRFHLCVVAAGPITHSTCFASFKAERGKEHVLNETEHSSYNYFASAQPCNHDNMKPCQVSNQMGLVILHTTMLKFWLMGWGPQITLNTCEIFATSLLPNSFLGSTVSLAF